MAEKKTRADYLRDPSTSSPLNRPAWTHSTADKAYLEELAKVDAARIVRAATSRGSDKDATAELQQKILAELLRQTPTQHSNADSLFNHTDHLEMPGRTKPNDW